jgi:hypothetical protein
MTAKIVPESAVRILPVINEQVGGAGESPAALFYIERFLTFT